MTYSIVAHDPHTNQFGVGVQTHQPTVGAVVPWAKPGVGAVATHSLTNKSFGPLGLELLEGGLSAEKTLAALLASDPGADQRQVTAHDLADGCRWPLFKPGNKIGSSDQPEQLPVAFH